MSDNGYDGERQFPFPKGVGGLGYDRAVQSRGQAILNSLMGFLASNYRSSIPSTEYSYYLRSMSIEMARMTLEIEELQQDASFERIRSEDLFEALGLYIFQDGKLPDQDFSDESFRCFLLAILDILFEGSQPKSLEKAIALFTDEKFTLIEFFKQARNPTSPRDISDQFGFSIEFDLNQNQIPSNLFDLQKNLEQILRIVKPAHTLFGIAYVFGEEYLGPNGGLENVLDEVTLDLHDRRYEDKRGYCDGMSGWESATGMVTDLYYLEDVATSSPMLSVKIGANLLVKGGVNTGRYTVKEILSEDKIRVTPRFKQSEDPLTYSVEVDRLGTKTETLITQENVSPQFVSRLRLEGTLNGPFNASPGAILSVQAFSNFPGGLTYTWDFTGDNVFNDATGDVVSYTVPNTPGTRLIRVRLESSDGRIARAQTQVFIS
jgi:hypothetical protein